MLYESGGISKMSEGEEENINITPKRKKPSKEEIREYYATNKQRISIVRALRNYKKNAKIPPPDSRIAYFCASHGLTIDHVMKFGIPSQEVLNKS